MAAPLVVAPDETPAPPAETSGSAFEHTRRRLYGPFVYPALALFVAIMVAPTLFTFWVSLNKWSGASAMEFVGLANYSRLAADPVFRTSFVNTAWIVLGVGIAIYVISFTLTMLLQDMIGRKTVRMVIFFPTLVPGIVVSILWGFLFNPNGFVNSVLRAVGIDDPPLWLAPDRMFSTIMLGLVWLNVGTYTVILMAAADRIPPELYEVADIEGASPFQRFRYVTLPLMWDVVSVTAVLWCIGALKVFEFLLTFSTATGTLPDRRIWNFALYSYATAFPTDGAARFGMASATGVVILLLTFLLTVGARRLMRRDDVTY